MAPLPCRLPTRGIITMLTHYGDIIHLDLGDRTPYIFGSTSARTGRYQAAVWHKGSNHYLHAHPYRLSDAVAAVALLTSWMKTFIYFISPSTQALKRKPEAGSYSRLYAFVESFGIIFRHSWYRFQSPSWPRPDSPLVADPDNFWSLCPLGLLN